MSDPHSSSVASGPTSHDDPPAGETYTVVERRKNRAKHWASMTAFWIMALISMGAAMPVPSSRSWAIVRRSDNVVVSTIDESSASDQSMGTVLDTDLVRLSTKEFEDAWGIG